MIGTDPGVDRRLPAAAELEVPFYAGMKLGVPSLPDLVETLADGRYDLVHVTAPGPAGIAATAAQPQSPAACRCSASYHTELAAYAGAAQRRRRGRGRDANRRSALFYGAPGSVLSPSPAADASLLALGIERGRIGRWERGVDLDRFDPAKADRDAFPGRDQGPLRGAADPREGRRPARRELPARPRSATPACTCCSPAAAPRRRAASSALGDRATFLGWLDGEELAVRLRQRRRLPLRQQYRHLRPGDPRGAGQRAAGRRRRRGRPGGAGREPPHRPALPPRPRPPGRRPAAAGRLAGAARPSSAPPAAARAGERSWERSLEQLAAGYRRALAEARAARDRRPQPLVQVA